VTVSSTTAISPAATQQAASSAGRTGNVSHGHHHRHKTDSDQSPSVTQPTQTAAAATTQAKTSVNKVV
jgi:hypothetical protein